MPYIFKVYSKKNILCALDTALVVGFIRMKLQIIRKLSSITKCSLKLHLMMHVLDRFIQVVIGFFILT